MGTKITQSVFGHTDDGKQVGIYVNEYTGKILYDQKKKECLSLRHIYIYSGCPKKTPLFVILTLKKG